MREPVFRLTMVLVFVSVMLFGCSTAEDRATAPAPRDTQLVQSRAAGLPKVLIIGDSISIGYFEPTKQLLEGKAAVYHNEGNAQHTAHGLATLDEWLGDTTWGVIHFNHGLHDLKYINEAGRMVAPAEGRQQIPIGDYARNLEELVKQLRKTGATLIFATTTPVPEGAMGRIKGDAERYNQVAVRIMKKHGVRINDLYAYALARLDSIQRPRNVHFTPAGSRLLAEQVAQSILSAPADK